MKSYLILLILTFVPLFMNSCSNTDKRYEIINRVLNSSNDSINYQLTIRDSFKIQKVSIRKLSNSSIANAFLSESILSDLKETNEIKFSNFNWQNITVDLNRLSNLKQLEFHYCSFKNVRFKNKKALSKCLFVYCNFDTLDIGEINTTELSYVKSSCEKIEVKSPNRFIESVKFNYSHINDLESSIHNMINLKEINLYKLYLGSSNLDLSSSPNLCKVIIDKENKLKLKVKKRPNFVLTNQKYYGYMEGNDCFY